MDSYKNLFHLSIRAISYTDPSFCMLSYFMLFFSCYFYGTAPCFLSSPTHRFLFTISVIRTTVIGRWTFSLPYPSYGCVIMKFPYQQLQIANGSLLLAHQGIGSSYLRVYFFLSMFLDSSSSYLSSLDHLLKQVKNKWDHLEHLSGTY